MSFSPETLALFKTLLDGQQLRAGAEDFADVAARVIKAQRELDDAIAEAQADDA